VQRADVPVTEGLFPPRVRRDAADGQVNFDEAFGIALFGHENAFFGNKVIDNRAMI
jgi:hypothetical protein